MGERLIPVDMPADLNSIDETGYVWTFLDEAPDQTLIYPRAIVVAGEPDTPAVAEVVDLVERDAGTVVHLRILPGRVEDYEELVERVRATG